MEESNNNTRKRSAAYPVIELETATEKLSHIKDNIGSGPYDRDTLARGLGYSGVSGASSRIIAALVHYSLLDRTGNTYQQSEIATKILMPTNENEKQSAIAEAFLSPVLFNNLIQKYKGESLPNRLEFILVREHGINEKKSTEVAEIFKKSAKYAGYLKNGVIHEYKGTPFNNESEQGQTGNSTGATTGTRNYKEVENPAIDGVPLPSGIVVYFPEQMKYLLGFGEFAEPLKQLEKKAQEHLAQGFGKEKEEAAEVKDDELEL